MRNDDGGVLAEKGSYPVTDATIQELTEALIINPYDVDAVAKIAELRAFVIKTLAE